MTDRVYDFLTAPGRTAAELTAKRRIRAEKLSALIPGAIRYDVPRVQTSPADRMSRAAAEIDWLDREIAELKRELRRQRRRITDTAGRLESPQEARAIVLHYVDGLRWADAAGVLHKSESSVFRIRRSAVEHLGELLGEKYPHNNPQNVDKIKNKSKTLD